MKKRNAFSVISYNLRFHKAAVEIEDLASRHKPDIMCLQECRAEDLPKKIGKLKLAGRTTIGHQGLATYINEKRFEIKSVSQPAIRLALWRLIIKEPRQRLLITEIFDKKTSTRILLANFHATHFIASNYHRRVETQAALTELSERGTNIPSVLIGDYNYPLVTKGLHQLVKKFDFHFAKPTSETYKGFGFADYFDFASYKNLILKKLETLPFGLSDHAPIHAEFDLSK